ncbi:hypothetical protein MAR_037449 [Mya arenaria]|uniref:Uncharacterized protein n=1 Tax=Mya arenaria TaxID=6604 RepID=A0ABY7FNJ1_MYAAR|nr:hypothetical protein MAR_037449 [Mya arenaria]
MDESLDWKCEMEVNLFHALRGHKPVDGDFSDLKDRSFPRLSVQKTEVDEKPSSEKLDKAESGTKPVKHEPRHMVGTPVINTPDNSPKRKRTRQTPSNASPATPEPPPPKRRR